MCIAAYLKKIDFQVVHYYALNNNYTFLYRHNVTFIGFGSQESWITTDIKTYTTNSKMVSTHQLSDELQNSQSATEFNAACITSLVNQSNRFATSEAVTEKLI